MALQRLVEKGVVEREGRGLYRLAGTEVSEHYSLLRAVKRVPQGVICLLSALRFHQLTTQKPFEVWLMLERGARRPAMDVPPLRIHYLSGEAFHAGIEEQHKMASRCVCIARRRRLLTASSFATKSEWMWRWKPCAKRCGKSARR